MELLALSAPARPNLPFLGCAGDSGADFRTTGIDWDNNGVARPLSVAECALSLRSSGRDYTAGYICFYSRPWWLSRGTSVWGDTAFFDRRCAARSNDCGLTA